MCVIVQVNADVEVADDVFRKCYDRNPDGWGIMYPCGGQVDTIKSLGTFKEFLDTWAAVPTDVNRAVHFRIATHGGVTLDNCHPFKITDTLAMMHNGIIQTNMVDKERSDSYNFAEYMLKPLVENAPRYVEQHHFITLVEALTKGSRLLFMDGQGNIKVTDEKAWVQRHDCLFSNSYSFYEPVSRGVVYSTAWTKKKETENWPSSSESCKSSYSDLAPYGRNEETDPEQAELDLALLGDNPEQEELDLTMEQVADMPYEDVLDWVQDAPVHATDMLLSLLSLICDRKSTANVK